MTGIDRATTAQIQALRDELHRANNLRFTVISVETWRTVLPGSLMLVGANLAVVPFSLQLVNRSLARPVQCPTEHITQLGHDDFGECIEIRHKDELGKLALAINTLRDFLVDIFERLRRSTRDLGSASGSLNAIISLMAADTCEQPSRTDQVATTMQEISTTAREMARYAGDAVEAADETGSSAQHGEDVMEKTIRNIGEMRKEIDHVIEAIHQLENDSGRTGRVLSAIHGIAEQTNPLTFDAATEAARVSDAGRGLMVVADEAHTLVQRIAEPIAEIHQTIGTVQSDAMNAAHAIRSGQSRSGVGAEQIAGAGAMLHQITVLVESIRDMNHQIATVAKEQAAMAENISRNPAKVASITSNNQGQVEQTEAASRNLHSLSTQLGDVLQRLQA